VVWGQVPPGRSVGLLPTFKAAE